MLLGIDLGGTKIEGIVLKSRENPEEVIRHRVNTEEEKGYSQVISNIKSLVDYIESNINHKFSKLGIGTPGTIDPESGLLKNSNSQCLNGMPIQKDLSKVLNKSILIQNDANCFALAETLLGSVKDKHPNAKNVFGIIMGTGVGGGVIIDGKTVYGSQGIGGEWGHTIVTDSGDECYCGKRGCVESVISGRALQIYYDKISGKNIHISSEHSAVLASNAMLTITFYNSCLLDSLSLGVPSVEYYIEAEKFRAEVETKS